MFLGEAEKGYYLTSARVKLLYSTILFKRLTALFLRPIARYWFVKMPC